MSEPSTTTIHPPQGDESRAASPVSGSDPLIQRRFRRSSIAFYLRMAVRLTDEDLEVARSPTLLGLIPLGRSRRSFPVDFVDEVSATKHVSIGGLLLGFLLASIGLFATLTGAVMVEVGAIAIALGAFSVLRSPSQAIVVRLAVGGSKRYGVAITERRRIARFAEQASTALEELHRRRGPVDLSEPRRRWRRHVLIRRLTALGIVVVLVTVAASGYRIYQDSDVGFWLEQQGIRNNSNDGRWNLAAPSGRPIATINPNETAIPLTVDTFPHVKQTEFPDWGYKPVGIDAYPSDPATPFLKVSGYLVAKEEQSDGSHLFAVEVPYLDGSLVPVAAGSTKPSCIGGQVDRSGQVIEDTVGGVIVWLRIFPATDTTWWPMETLIGYGDDAFVGRRFGVGMGPDVLYEYTQVGDPIRVDVNLGYDFTSPQATKDLKMLVDYRHASNAADARAQIEAALGKNMKTWQTLSADCGKAVPLAEQFQGKRYVLSPFAVAFLPVATE